jgi:hypothetical protein
MCQTFVNIRHYKNKDWDWLRQIDHLNFCLFCNQPVNWTCWTDASAGAIAGMVVNHTTPLVTGPLTADNYYKKLNMQMLPWSKVRNHVYRDKFDLNPTQVATVKIAHRVLTPSEVKTDSNEREL